MLNDDGGGGSGVGDGDCAQGRSHWVDWGGIIHPVGWNYPPTFFPEGVPGIYADPVSFSGWRGWGGGSGLKFDSLPYINWRIGLLSTLHFYPWLRP